MAGRRPKPLEIHRINGNPSMLSKAELEGKDNVNPEKGAPEMPKGMPHVARREWKKITKELLAIGVLSRVDGKALMGYCVAYANWQAAQKCLDKYGPVIQTSFQDEKTGEIILGDLKNNPAASQAKIWLMAMKSFLIEFGLTPAARRNLKIEKKDEEDPMQQFLNRKQKTVPPQTETIQ